MITVMLKFNTLRYIDYANLDKIMVNGGYQCLVIDRANTYVGRRFVSFFGAYQYRRRSVHAYLLVME